MFFKASLYIALIIFGLGLIYKVSTWFRYGVGINGKEVKGYPRFSAAIKGIISTILSPKILTLLEVFLLDVLFQRKIFRESRLRWVMHMCIFWGFTLLLLMHALENYIPANIAEGYASTLFPFIFLRTLFGVMVIAGLAISFYRRHILKTPRLMNNAMDHYMVIILAVIMISGFLLEGTKIPSHTKYREMVEDYSDEDDKETLKALESFWVEYFAIASPDIKGPFGDDILAEGKDLHESNCAGCHSRPQWAFISYGVATAYRPFGVSLDRAGFPVILWYIHFLACFIGLAYLPFSRMFHIFVSPLSLLANAVMVSGRSDPLNIATRQVMELDACTHCGTCTSHCSVGVTFELIPNVNILPSEKLASLKRLASGKKLSEKEMKTIQEGLYLCTNCHNCTLVCPVGINLQEIWFNVREAIFQKDYPELLTLSPLSLYRGLRGDEIEEEEYQRPLRVVMQTITDECGAIDGEDVPIDHTFMDQNFKENLSLSTQGNTFSYCFTCTTCTTSCPVACNFENPPEAIGMVPHQIIHAAIVGLPDLIFKSGMLWDCLGCYQCQDACPQGVRITDVFYELKNMAHTRMKGASQ